MTTKTVVFYSIEATYLSIAIKLVEKKYIAHENVLLLCEDDDEVNLFDSQLWTYSKSSFIPHGSSKSMQTEDAKFCQTWIATEVVFHNNPNCIIHNGLHLLEKHLLKFNTIIDISDKNLGTEIEKRSEFYKEAGFVCQKLWIQNNTIWDQGDL
jgi:DNA polymerase IIIc chi subunit